MASANDFFHKVGRSTATTLASPGYTTGDTSINVASTTNWPADTGVTFAIDEVDSNGLRVSGTYNVFRGKVAGGTQIDEVTYVGGDTNRNYSAGATTRVYILVSSYRDNRFTDGILEEHKQDGTHSDINADSLDVSGAANLTDLSVSGTLSLPAGSIETADYGDGSVSNAKLKSGAGEPAGSWDSWSCTTTNITLGTGGSIVTTYKQIGKTVHFYIKVQLGTGGSLGGQPTFTPPVTMHSKYSTGNQVLGLAWYEDVGIGNSIGLIWVTAGNIRPAAMGVGSSYANWSGLSGSLPFTWGDGDYMVLASTYEAA